MLQAHTNMALMGLMIPVLALVAIVQAVIGPHLALLQVKPNLVLLLVLAWTLIRGRREGMFVGFLGGIWLDLLSMSTLGLSSLALVAASFLAGLGRHQVLTTHILVLAWTAVVGTLVFSAVFHLMLALIQTTGVWLEEMGSGLWAQMIFQTGLMLLLVPFLRRLLPQDRIAQPSLGYAG